jgi:hypothetical protein
VARAGVDAASLTSTQYCVRQDIGPIRVGSTWRDVSKFLGRKTILKYRLELMQPGHITVITVAAL